jgi:signal transduction histidine kinase
LTTAKLLVCTIINATTLPYPILYNIKVVNNLLTFEKIEAGMMVLSMAPTPLVEFLTATVKLQLLPAMAKQIHIAVIPPPRHQNISVDIDPKKLGLVFNNLISNAVKFTPEHGHISISIYVDTSSDSGNSTTDTTQKQCGRVLTLETCCYKRSSN